MLIPSRAKPLSRSLPGLVLLAFFASGCGRAPEPTFTPADATAKLIPQVRDGMTAPSDKGDEVRLDGVTDQIDARFGSLATPVYWPALPVEFGGDRITVAKVIAPTPEEAEKAEEDRPLEEIVVSLSPAEGAKLAPLAAGAQVGWTAGTYEGRISRVKSFDPATNQVALTGTFAEGLPDEGDELLVHAGGKLAAGRALYARHCMHCHGAGGAGDGPTARYLDPKPRDYRLGVYKFTSTGAPDKANRADLLDVLERGIPGTSMPAFRLLPRNDLEALVEYVRWLSMRGEFENQLATTVASYEYTQKVFDERIAGGDSRDEILEEVRDFLESDLPDEAETAGEIVAQSWAGAEDPAVVVTPTMSRVADSAESRARGREIFLSDKTKCAACHGQYGKGDGPQTETVQTNSATNEPWPRPGLHDNWGNLLRPRDLTQGIFRGGRRPIDLYRRIYAGIKGTPMSGFGGSLTEAEIWHVVNYVLSVPYEPVPDPGQGKALALTGH